MITIDWLAGHVAIGVRLMAKRPGLAVGRALTVTVVVTAVSAVFTVANATFLRPLPFPGADRLVRVYLQPPGTTDFAEANSLDPFDFVRLRDRTRALERLDGMVSGDRAVSGDGEPDAIAAARVSAGFFPLLGGDPLIGRVFTEAEADADARVVVLSHGLWMRRFGGDRSVVGRALLIDRDPYTIIGVVRAGFEPAFAPSEFWTPLSISRSAPPALLTSVQSIGLLRRGVTLEQARTDLEGLFAGLRAESPSRLKGWTLGLVDLREAQYGSRRPAILMLLAAVAALALIAIANLANLTLADVASRRADFAVRAALGGSRADLAAPDVAQGLGLAAVGALAGLLGSAWLVPAILSLDPSSALGRAQVSIDWRVVTCGMAVAVAVMAAAVVAPVLRAAGPALASDVAARGPRATGGPGAERVRVALVTAQTALALVLLSSGALVVATFHQTARTDPGFDPANVVTAQLRLSAAAFPTEESRAAFVEQVLERLRATPGIVNAGTTLNRFVAGNAFQTIVHVEDRPTADGQPYAVQFRRVSPGYFETMRIALVCGRLFDHHDRVGAQPVAIVSRRFAGRFWPNQDPLGRRIKRGSTAQTWAVVVGVVDDVRDVGIDQATTDMLYTPYFQGSNPAAPVGLVVRTGGHPVQSVAAIKRAVWAIDGGQPLGHVVTLDEFLASSLGPQRFRAMLVAVCGILGLLLATIGTYGITARSVVERTREVAIRLALGGRPGGVWWTAAWASLRGVMAGALMGAAASGVAGALLSALLPDLHGANWRFSAVAASALVIVGALAALTAARRATAVEPVRALRMD